VARKSVRRRVASLNTDEVIERKQAARPRLPAVSEEMKAWSAALEAEIAGWPSVSNRPMFGFTALYRGKRIFAILPRSRGMESPNSLAFKLEDAGPRVLARLRGESRIHTTVMRASRWFVFELYSDRDLKDALDWLGRAYEAAG
jgi:hypothetical protein